MMIYKKPLARAYKNQHDILSGEAPQSFQTQPALSCTQSGISGMEEIGDDGHELISESDM